eukprot:scaffold13182_cov64-Attheya_sp.AAC.5
MAQCSKRCFLAVDGTTELGHAFHLEAPWASENQKQDEIDFSRAGGSSLQEQYVRKTHYFPPAAQGISIARIHDRHGHW